MMVNLSETRFAVRLRECSCGWPRNRYVGWIDRPTRSKNKSNGGSRRVDPPYFSKTNSFNRYTLRLHRRLREIAGFRLATLPGLEHTLAVHCGFWVNRARQVLHDEAYV